MNTLKFITLPNSRRIAYSEYGGPNGTPVFHFHGAYSSRFEPLLIGDERIKQHGLRVIAPDRPGMGKSDYQKGRQYQDYPEDISYLADALEIKQFAVVGVSGGGPYVTVCATTIPDRLTTATIVSGAWRMDWPESLNNLALGNRLTWICAKRLPWLSSMLQKVLVASMTGDREKVIK